MSTASSVRPMAGDAPCAMPSTSNARRSCCWWAVICRWTCWRPESRRPIGNTTSGTPAVAGVTQDIHVALGNHDILGVADESPLDESHPMYGKKYFLERFGLERTYYSFDHEGWHFVVLDSLAIEGNSYKGWIDPEQIAWLDDDLAASGKPTVIATHVPIFTNYIQYTRGTEGGIPGGMAVVNSHEVAPVIEKHGVRLVLAGHLHINESFRYKRTEYATVGAVSGNWWKGERSGFQEGYAVLSFHGDEVSWTYIDYGWEPPPEAAEAPA